jgi:hypothetical protein
LRVGRLRVDLGKGSSGRVTTWQKSAISRTLPIGDFRRMTAKSGGCVETHLIVVQMGTFGVHRHFGAEPSTWLF